MNLVFVKASLLVSIAAGNTVHKEKPTKLNSTESPLTGAVSPLKRPVAVALTYRHFPIKAAVMLLFSHPVTTADLLKSCALSVLLLLLFPFFFFFVLIGAVGGPSTEVKCARCHLLFRRVWIDEKCKFKCI